MPECFQHLPAAEDYLYLPADAAVDNPLDMEAIKEQQDADHKLLNQTTKYADCHVCKSISGVDDVLCYVKPGDPLANRIITLPKSLLQPTIRWFHESTGHPGSKRLQMQISSQYYHQDLQGLIDKHHCNRCQINKLDGKGYGLLPEHEVHALPFEECTIDLIGLWTIQFRDELYEFNALTMIGTVSNLAELVRIDNKTSAHITHKFNKSG